LARRTPLPQLGGRDLQARSRLQPRELVEDPIQLPVPEVRLDGGGDESHDAVGTDGFSE